MFYSLPSFEYTRADSLSVALDLLKEGNWKLLAGGTDLLIDIKTGRQAPKKLLDISRINEIRYVRPNENIIRIGGGSRLQELLENIVIRERLPLLASAIREMASWQIRNVATIAGNLCNASPAADSAPPLLVHEAKVRLASTAGSRIVPLKDFFIGPRKTVMRDDEMLTEIEVPSLEGYSYWYYKLGRRNAFTLSVVSVAVALKIEDGKFSDVRIALGSVAPKPVRALSVEEELVERNADVSLAYRAAELVERDISPISDVRASADYRMKVSKVLIKRALIESIKRSRGELL
ncbi:MAG: xanthine dehydrogenase family protein subunit M [Fervidicoccaceae archaeon]